ncbi:cytotoxin [Effusibacillus dendaii]|uniref:Cytotoxin n=1 Tax=Effusibacillus dendaii TaxID=2743772 RepID=A0A7I8DCA0_9BACL|nr:cytotoxin [Effusibacillus dendaii]BCJ87803.1 hypothetical protein skT53_27880 [Effusibacillus dendaii]
MIVVRSDRFVKVFKKLGSKEEQKRIICALELMGRDFRHPSLRVKRIQGTEALWEASASMDLRIVFEMTEDAIYLYRCGQHDILNRL